MNFDRENKKSHGAGHTQSMISSNGTSLIFFFILNFWEFGRSMIFG